MITVVGVTTVPARLTGALPPLLQTPRLAAIAATGALDGTLLLVLEHARLLPDVVWTRIAQGGTVA